MTQIEVFQFGQSGLSFFYYRSVEAPAEASIAGEDDDGDFPDGSRVYKGEIDVVSLDLLDDEMEKLGEGLGEGAAVDYGFLGSSDFSGGDEFHGFGELLGVLDGV